jgi:hypothetical protein
LAIGHESIERLRSKAELRTNGAWAQKEKEERARERGESGRVGGRAGGRAISQGVKVEYKHSTLQLNFASVSRDPKVSAFTSKVQS